MLHWLEGFYTRTVQFLQSLYLLQKRFLLYSGGFGLTQYESSEIKTSNAAMNRPLTLIIWVLGLVCGVLLFLYSESAIVSMMRRIPFCSVSIVSLLLTGFVPFLFTAYAVFTFQPWFIAVICFCDSCLLSFLTSGISMAYASAGWLICCITLCFNSIRSAVLLFLWFRLFRIQGSL